MAGRMDWARLFRRALMWTLAASMTPCLAAEPPRSGESNYSANPYIAFGINPRTNLVTGYVFAHRTGPGATDLCEFMFRGAVGADGKAGLAIIDLTKDSADSRVAAAGDAARLSVSNKAFRIDLPKSLAPGDCDWILEMHEGPNVRTTAKAFTISVGIEHHGDWIAMARIRSKRAFFHRTADARAVRKAFVVAGDIVRVTEEKPGWYHVRYGDAAKPTSGWIRASDLAPF